MSLPCYPLFGNLTKHNPTSKAIIHSATGQAYTYGQLVADVVERSRLLHVETKRQDGQLKGERVALLMENGYSYVVNLLAIMAADAIAVPLSPTFPVPELRYVLDHSKVLLLLASQLHLEKALSTASDLEQAQPAVVVARENSSLVDNNDVAYREIDADGGRDAGGLMLYTSGTTSRPKGVLLPTRTLNAQCLSLQEAWQYSASDHVLHVLPLHHIHGVVNAVLTPLMSGSTIEFSYPFNPTTTLNRIAAPFMAAQQSPKQEPITFFTAVPTVYSRLLNTFASLPSETQTALRIALSPSNMRLNISGSAALPLPTQQAWTDLTGGNILLERYGMTEVGMALSCGLSFSKRVNGSVGWPLPGVKTRLVSEDGQVISEAETEDEDGKALLGEVQLKGETIFQEYWENERATAASFTEDGWFRTGDVASRRWIEKTVSDGGAAPADEWVKGPAYYIQGRASADIIKTGGEKISALEVEREVLALPHIAEVAVVGLPSEAWGQKVAAVVVLTPMGRTAGKGGGELSVLDLRRLLRDRLAPFKIPQDLLVVDEIKRNAMGKVNKTELVQVYFGDKEQIRRRSVEERSWREQERKGEAERR